MLKYRTHGKWILAGEHTVLRGGRALVFPVQSRYLDFSFKPGGDSLKLNIESDQRDLELAFWGVLEKALNSLGLNRNQMTGRLNLESNIPVGAGMGASATLCVSLARWFESMGHLPSDELYSFAKQLEDVFHGQSSGVDVAVALNNQALLFKIPEQMEFFEPSWQPHFYLSYCGKRGITADCIRKVQKLFDTDPSKAQALDEQMKKAVELALVSLSQSRDLGQLVEAIECACDCFYEWKLISCDLDSHMKLLKEQGAIATKPTGSGEGGFVLSLWGEPPSADVQEFLGVPLIQA